MPDEFLYLYCVARRIPDTELEGMTGHLRREVSAVYSGELMAAVSKIDKTSLDVTLENLSRHEKIISELMKKTTVLPMSFSTVAKSEDEAVKILEKYGPQFEENLKRVAGKAELGLKVFYRLAPPPDRRPAAGLKPKEYMLARFEAYREEQKKLSDIFRCVEKLHEQLAERSSESCFTKPLKNNLIFNASYLVPESREEEFRQMVGEAQAQNTAYLFSFSGPWPAYHFVKIIREGEAE